MAVDGLGTFNAVIITGMDNYTFTEEILSSSWIIFGGNMTGSFTAAFPTDPEVNKVWLMNSSVNTYNGTNGSILVTMPSNLTGVTVEKGGFFMVCNTDLVGLVAVPLDTYDAQTIDSITLDQTTKQDGDIYTYDSNLFQWRLKNVRNKIVTWVMNPTADAGTRWIYPGATQITSSASDVRVTTAHPCTFTSLELFANSSGTADIKASLYSANDTTSGMSESGLSVTLTAGNKYVTCVRTPLSGAVDLIASGSYAISFEVAGDTSCIPSNISVVLSE